MPIASVLDEQVNLAEVKPLIESSTYRSYQAYVKAGFPDKIPRSVSAPYERENKFLSAVDESKGPIQRKITRMVRRKHDGKEYLTFTENWHAIDWKNAQIKPIISRIEGMLELPRISPKIDEKGQKIGRNLDGNDIKYEIEFSKSNVDKWLEETGTDKDSVTYTVRTDRRRDNCVAYEQFVNTTWIQANDIMMQGGGFEMAYVESLRSHAKTKA